MSKITQSAHGEPCQIRLAGYCNHNPETTVLAHYRLADYCGMGIKPPFSGVPLTHTEHTMQHQHGEAYVLAANGIVADDAAAWFEAKADEYLERWKNRNG